MAEGWSVAGNLDFLTKPGVIEYTERGKKLFPDDAL